MAQYTIFLALAPVAFLVTLFGMLLPRFFGSYRRYWRLLLLQALQLVFIAVNAAELLAPDPTLKRCLAAADYLLVGSGTAMFLL